MLSIGQFSQLTRLSAKTLRFYDEIGLLKPLSVDEWTGYRYYSVDQLDNALLILRLKDYGFSLEEISRVQQNPKELAAMFAQKKAALKRSIQQTTYLLSRLEQDLQAAERGKDIMTHVNELKVDVAESPALAIYSRRQKMRAYDYGKVLAELIAEIQAKGLTPAGAPLAIFHDSNYDPENYDMEVAVPVSGKSGETRDFAGQRCAHVDFTGAYSELPSVYSRIQKWLTENGFEVAGPTFEIYHTDPRTTAPEKQKVAVYFPIHGN